jgi:methyl-accepting chemotaxis protein
MADIIDEANDKAGEANNLIIDAKDVVATANQSMGRLTDLMGEITKASEETSKIIKTIDEIAFQTNLLALNAAVEAARAGEAGAGFAVVADEVRNLAMLAVEAAKNTANLIEGTVKKVKDGSNLVSRTNEASQQVAGSSAKAADLVAEIAAASNEQAQGIDQINTAVTELDKVTQQNAANAEESASEAEEMSAQAETMQGIVGELVAIVGGAGKPDAAGRTKTDAKSAKAKHALSAGVRKAMGKVGIPKRDAKPAGKALPLGENELVEFENAVMSIRAEQESCPYAQYIIGTER